MEYANAVYSRGMEITYLLQRMENDNIIPRGHHLYKFRTGELSTFTELAKRAGDLGSRRLTHAQMLLEMRDEPW